MEKDKNHKVIIFESGGQGPSFCVSIQCDFVGNEKPLGKFFEIAFAIEYAQLVATRLKCEWKNNTKA